MRLNTQTDNHVLDEAGIPGVGKLIGWPEDFPLPVAQAYLGALFNEIVKGLWIETGKLVCSQALGEKFRRECG